MFAVLALLYPAPIQDLPGSLEGVATPEQVALHGYQVHARIAPAEASEADPRQWVQVVRGGGLQALVVAVEGDEAWLPELADAASQSGVRLGWSLVGADPSLSRLLELSSPFLVELGPEPPAGAVALVAERAPGCLLQGGLQPQVAGPDQAALAEGWVVPLVSAPAPQELLAFEELYLSSVGRGQNLALELPLDGEGRVPQVTAQVLAGCGELLARTFETDRAATSHALASHTEEGHPAGNVTDGNPGTWWAAPKGRERCFFNLDLGTSRVLDTVVLAEPLTRGARIQSFRLQARKDNSWTDVHQGGSIGARRVLRLEPEVYQGFRLIITESSGAPALSTFGLFAAPPKVEVHVDETVFMGSIRARFSTSSPDALVRYTLDGSLPTGTSPLYTGPVTIDRSCRLTALASSPGNPGLVPASVDLRAYTSETLASPVEPPAARGLLLQVWEGQWDRLSQVDWSEPPADRGLAPVVDRAATSREGRHALVYEGLVRAPRAGIYGLFARGGEEVRVLLAGERVVVSSGGSEELGELGLQAGWHTIRIEVLRHGDADFGVHWRGPAISKRPFEAEELGR